MRNFNSLQYLSIRAGRIMEMNIVEGNASLDAMGGDNAT
jgi:hypothetical protein